MQGLKRRGRIWWINKTVKVKGKGHIRLRESTFQADEQLAKEVLERRITEEAQRLIYGLRREFKFSQGAAKYLEDRRKLGKDVTDDLYHLDMLIPFLGGVFMSELHNQHPKLVEFKEARKDVKNNTLNRSLEKVRLIVNLASTEWIDEGKTWLAQAPKIKLLPRDDESGGYPLTWGQQRALFSYLPDHIRRMALFAVNTGVRSEQVSGLKWEWERHIPGVGTVFDLPTSKNSRPYRVPLNRIAREAVESCRGCDSVYVFTYPGNVCSISEPINRRILDMRSPAWRRAVQKAGLDDVRGHGEHFRVHDLRHTFSTRLREAGVSREDRKDLMGHKNEDITTHYSTAETAHLMACVERLVEMNERPSVYVVAHS